LHASSLNANGNNSFSKAFWKKRQKNRLKEGSKGADVNEDKFVLNIDVLFAL
jgi:hypothetical protein